MSSTFLVIGLGGAIGLLSVYQGAKKVGFTTCPLGMQVVASMYLPKCLLSSPSKNLMSSIDYSSSVIWIS